MAHPVHIALTSRTPRYCDVAVERWQRFPGREAVLDGAGRTFGELRVERASP